MLLPVSTSDRIIGPDGPPATEERRTVERRLWRDNGSARLRADAGVACAIAGAMAWFAAAIILSDVVDEVFLRGGSGAAARGGVLVIAGLIVVRAAFVWAAEAANERAGSSVVHALRRRLTAALFGLGPTFARGERAGELVRLAGEGVESVGPLVTRFRPARLAASIVPPIVAVTVFVLDPWSVLILLVTGPLLVLLLALIGRRVRDATARREEELSWMSAHFLDVLRGLPTLKLFGRATEQAETIEAVGRRNAATTMDVLRTAFQTTLVLEWGATAATALVAVEVSVRLMDGAVPFARALAVLLLTPEFFAPLRRLSAEYHTGPAGVASAARIFDVLDRPRPVAMRAAAAAPVPERHGIRLDRVSVGFDGGARRALAGLTLEIPHGGSVALVGSTGAGKSTVASLLLRFVDPDDGVVTVDGRDLTQLDARSWRARIAWVPQHPDLFSGTVAENLRLGRDDASDGDLWDVLATVASDGFVRALPRGLSTQVGEGGVRLSGGERQRLALGRAVLRDAPILILDEATSHLDDETQQRVLAGLADVILGRTVLLIAHRAEVAKIADVVAVMEGGQVVELVGPDEVDRVGARGAAR
jgi:ATP-binding cassette, subfamily C, bacterial CydD